MKWHKRRIIFNPTDHFLGSGIVGFAQGPQALVFNDYVRIYFSARKMSPNGKYISCIRYADFDKRLHRPIRVSAETVIVDGKLGTFDEHGIFPMNVVRVGDLIYGYTCGWSRRSSVSIDMAIGLAISRDNGISFQRVGEGPVLAASLNEPFLIGDPYVAIMNGSFHMWYIYGTAWKRYPEASEPERVYKIGYATSTNGRDWHRHYRHQLIADLLGGDECQAMPTVIRIDDLYHMFFCYRESFDFRQRRERGYKIGHAASKDLLNWTRSDNDGGLLPSDEGWDSEMVCYPHVFRCENSIYMLYNGNAFGRFGFGVAELELSEDTK